MDLLLFLKIEILCWRIMTPSLRGGSISLGYLDFLIVIPAGGKFRRIAHPQ
ncbi:hypothetical protein COXBURSA331_A1759 [Coxiella burnetii RSA 331]|nr:hypothetical protein COXBURSA331_A1759 [Coxiella burnetii RSA 331]